MSILPINNFEEHLARFTAAKQNISANSKACHNKKFTFRKSLSLGKHEVANHSSEVTSKSIRNETSVAQEIQLDINTKPKFSSDFLQNVTLKNHNQLNILNFNETHKKTSPDIRKYFSTGEPSDNQVDSDLITGTAEIDHLRPTKTSKPVCNVKSISKAQENVIPESNATIKESGKHNELKNEKNIYFPKVSEKKKPQILNDFGKDERKWENSTTALKEMNFKIMTKICNIIEKEKHILMENKELYNLISYRKKILHQQSGSDNETQYSKNIINTSSSNDEIFTADEHEDFLVSKGLKSANAFSSFNSSVLSEKSCSKSDSSNSAKVSSNNVANESSILKGLPFVSAKSLYSSSPNPPSTSKAAFETNGLLKDNSFENQFECKAGDNSVENLDESFIENIGMGFSDLENEESTNEKIQKPNDSKVVKRDKIIAGKFYGNQRDDGASSQYKGFQFPFSQDVMLTFQNVFGLKQFRHNQLETINAALLGEDCFVLMPTGGGKSLCYQLPALVSTGVTIVISPLRSLIMDQVQKLCSLDIPATSLTGDTDASAVNYVYSQLASREPTIKLLYVTPEKISASPKLVSCLENLYSRSMIQRFVIDEAHCVSQWGHDFRPDYKRLKVLREKFPKVPLMALTATATQRVRGDILHQLGMQSPKWFLQSFNRPNLKYEVRPKTKSVVADIIELLQSRFRNMCGIIYCLSRNDCDTVADILKNNGIKATSYHAGLNNRDEIQEQWINDRFKVICATIAFGMGIDKPDVRFVIHHAIPKSIEGYYQESGRAGRDGERSWCILFYCYKDMQRIKRMITKDDANTHSWSTHFDNLFKMVHYCENRTDCRRVWMLGYFGEIFDKMLCLNKPETSCDNCYSKEIFVECDLTEDAKYIVQCIAKLVDKRKRQNYTLTYFVDIYKGAKTQKLLAAGHNKLELYGKGQSLHRSDAERLLRKLVLDQYLQEDMVINKMDLPITYIYLGKRAKDLLTGKAKVVLSFQKSKGKHRQTVSTSVEDKEIQELIEKCYNELIEISKTIASERNMHYTNVINVEALRQMSREMPMTEEDMLTIPHVTHAVYEKYGKRFLEVTQRYAAERCVIDAEKEDLDMLSACVENVSSWSDTDAGTSKGPVRKGVKRKASKGTAGKTKKQKKFIPKKFQKAKTKGSYSAYLANKKKQSSQKKVTGRAPGLMPNPKILGKPALRSFLPTPRVVFK